MKTLRLLLVLTALLALAPRSEAATSESHRAAIDRFFKVLKLDKQYETGMMAGFDASSGLTADRLASLPAEQKEKIQRGVTKVKAKMVELMGWEKMKPDMMELYARHFTEKEIDDIVKLMETPTGQMMLAKQIALLPEAMALGQKKALAVLPEIMKVMQDEMK
jgi:hypothetical protein